MSTDANITQNGQYDRWLEVYSRSLETQIENKRDFLRQSQLTMKKLRDEPGENAITSVGEEKEQWKAFMRKPMLFPERSDPIGLSLAHASLFTRRDSTLDWLETSGEQLSRLEEMVSHQRAVNDSLDRMARMLSEQDKNSEDPTTMTIVEPSKFTKDKNTQLWESLTGFVRSQIFDQTLSEEDTTTIMTLLTSLIKKDPNLQVASFHTSALAKKLYRLLLRTNLIAVEAAPLDDITRHVTLIDFNESL